MAEPKPNPKDNHEEENDLFYEAMPGMASHYIYRDNALSSELPEDDQLLSDRQQRQADNAKLTAIVTLILVALTALALAVLFMRGLDVIKSTTPTNNAGATSSGSLEL